MCISSFCIVVETSSLRGRFQSFIKHFVDDLGELDEAEFERNRAAAIATVLKKRTTFGEQLGWNHTAAFSLDGDFEADDRHADALKALTFDGFKAAVPTFFADAGARRMCIQVIGATERHRFQDSTIEELRESGEGFWQRPKHQAELKPVGL